MFKSKDTKKQVLLHILCTWRSIQSQFCKT